MATAIAVAPGPLDDDEGPRMIRVKKGAQPTHSTLNPLQRWAWRTFRDRVTKLPPDPALEENLVKAHIRIRADEYMAYAYGLTIIIGVVLTVVGIVLGFILASTGSLLFGVVAAVVIPVIGTIMVFVILPSQPC